MEGTGESIPVLPANEKIQNTAKFDFTTVCRNVTVKQVNIVLFLIFSGQEVHNSTSLIP